MEGEEDVNTAHKVVYRYVLPVLVVLGVVGSSLSIFIFSKPNLKKQQVNRYFMLLAVFDLLVCISYISIIITMSGCVFQSALGAYYFAHCGWSLTAAFHCLSTYSILWLSLDRFTAVWFPKRAWSLQKQPNLMRTRMLATVIVVILIHLPFMVDAEVQCKDGMDHLNDDTPDYHCDNSTHISVDGYQRSYNQTWHKVYRTIYFATVRWIPSVLMAICNLGLVVGMVQNRVPEPVKRKLGSSGERVLNIIMITMSASYLLLTLPITVYLTGFADHHDNRCSANYPDEMLRHVGNLMQLTENVIHIVFFFCIISKFKDEVYHLFGCPVGREAPRGEVTSSIVVHKHNSETRTSFS